MQRMRWVAKKKDPGGAAGKCEPRADGSPLDSAKAGAEPAQKAVGGTLARGKRSRGKFLKEDARPAAGEAEPEEEERWDWSCYVTVRDTTVTTELGGCGVRDKDLPGLFVYVEETLERVRQSKSCYKHNIDLSDSKDVTDRGVVDHLVPFLERWPECHRLKLYKTSCGEEAIASLAPWISMGHARELHLSDMCGQFSVDSVLTLLREVHRGGKYPYRLNDKARCALWLRLEHNGIPSKEVVQKASKEGLSFRVLEKEEIRTVRPGVPSRKRECAIHLVIFHAQGLRVKRELQAYRPKADSKDSCTATSIAGNGSVDALVPATSIGKGASEDTTPAVASKAGWCWTEKVPQNATAVPAGRCGGERAPVATGRDSEGAPRATEDSEAPPLGAPPAEAADGEPAGDGQQPPKDELEDELEDELDGEPDGEPSPPESRSEHPSDRDDADWEATPAAAGGVPGLGPEPAAHQRRLCGEEACIDGIHDEALARAEALAAELYPECGSDAPARPPKRPPAAADAESAREQPPTAPPPPQSAQDFPDRLPDQTGLAGLTRRGGAPGDRLAALLLGAAAVGLVLRRGRALWRRLRARPLAGALLAAAAAQWLWQVARLQLWGALRGPWPAPLLGTAWRVVARSVPTLHKQNAQDRCLFGDIFGGTYWGTHLAVTACPYFARRIFISHWKAYDRSKLEKECFSELLGQGLILVDNAEWGEMRRLYQPAFSDGNLLAFGGLIKHWTTNLADTLLAESRSERPIDIQSVMQQFTFRLIGMFALGVDFDDRARYASEYSQMSRADIGCSNFGELWGTLLERSQDRLPFGRLQWWKLVKTRGVRSFERAHKLLLDLVDRIIEDRSNGHDQVSKPVEFQDLLSLILGEKGRRYTRTEARHQVLTFLFAGHDTTTSLVSWCLWLLAASPEHLARAQAEADAHALEGGGRPFLRSCLLETLRLYPSVPARGRSLEAAGDEFAVPAPERCPMLRRTDGRLPLARGTAVVLAVNAVHRHPGHWERPDAFEPSRFEGHLRPSAGSPLFGAPRPSEKDDALTYLPFGAGPRRCIGERLALLEAEEICGGLLRRCGVRLPPGARRPDTELVLTLRARGGIRLLLDDRGAGGAG